LNVADYFFPSVVVVRPMFSFSNAHLMRSNALFL